jgi:hypothetical protein
MPLPLFAARPAKNRRFYELKDGKPDLIPFQVENGVYIVSKVLDNAYLALGNKKITLARRIDKP